MGRLEQEARDERVRLQKQRMTLYGSLPYQTFMVHAIKAPLMEGIGILTNPAASQTQKIRALYKIRKALKAFEKNFPEPSLTAKEGEPGYCWHPNSQRLIALRDEFFTHCKLGGSRDKLMRLGINFVIVIYDYDPPYRMMIDWWADKLQMKNWKFDIPVTVHGHSWWWWTE